MTYLFSYLCTLYAWQVASTAFSRRIIEPISRIYSYLLLSVSYKVVLIHTHIFAQLTFFQYIYAKTCTYGIAVYIEIRSTILQSVMFGVQNCCHLQYYVYQINTFTVTEPQWNSIRPLRDISILYLRYIDFQFHAVYSYKQERMLTNTYNNIQCSTKNSLRLV